MEPEDAFFQIYQSSQIFGQDSNQEIGKTTVIYFIHWDYQTF